MYLFLTILTMSTALLRAQEVKKNSFGINLGMGSLKKQDMIFSPFIVKDWSPLNVLLEYGHTGKVDQKVSLRFGQYSDYTGEPFSYYARGIEYEKLPHSTSNIDLNYSITKSVFHTNKWKISAGGRYRNRFQMTNFEFGHAGQFSYNLSYGLDALINLGYQSGKHTIQSEIALPIFSFLARSPYTSQDDAYLERIMVHGDLKIFAEHLKSATFQSWNTSKMVDLDLSYNYALNEKWDLGVTYLFAMNLHNTPLPYTSFENVIYIGTTLKF